MSKTQNIVQSIYAKIAFAVVLGFIGVVSGIYVGNAIINTDTDPNPHYSDYPDGYTGNQLDAQFVDFSTGDLFPLEDYTDIDGNTGNFEQLLEGKDALLFFVSFTCEPCHDMLKFFRQNLRDRLNPDVKVIACLKDVSGEIPEEYRGLLSDMEVVYYDAEYWAAQYDLRFWPLVIGVDNSGFVKHIQFGFEDYIDYPLMEYYFESNR